MATFDTLRAGGTAGFATGARNSEIVIHEISGTSVAAITGVAAGDKITVVDIPADSYVEVLQIEIMDATVGGTTRIDVGDESSDTQWVSNATTLTAGTNLTLENTAKAYSTADSLFIKYTTGTPTGGEAIRVAMRITDTSRNAPATTV